MEDSSMFMQWALSTLQHEHPPPTPAPASDNGGGHNFASLPEVGYSASLNSMVPGEPPAREGHRATSSWSSGDTDTGSGGGRSGSIAALERNGRLPPQNSATMYAAPPSSGVTNQPVSWNFSSASARPSKEAMPMRISASAAGAATDHGGGGSVPLMVQESQPTRRTTAITSLGSPSSVPYVQHHIMAERKRREKINQRFIELSTFIPGLKKMDKATILSDATRYVKELQEKLKAHEDGCSSNGRRNIDSAALVKKKPRTTVLDDEDGGSPSYAASAPPATTRGALPEIEARISEGNVNVKIHCEDVKGSLVRLLAEVEELHLSIVHANAMSFPASTMIINIMAKVEEGFNTTKADDIVERLCRVLNQHSKEGTRSCC